MARASTVLVQGRVGIVDAALVRWLRDQKNKMDHLAVCITQSVYEPVVPKSHLEEFLSGLGIVDAVLQRSDKFNFGHQQAHLSNDATLVRFPEDDLLDYSIKFICKRRPVVEGEFHSKQLTTLDGLCKCYGSRPPRQKTVGMVSGVFDLIHPGHISLIRKAKAHTDCLVVLAMSSAAIGQQEKNHLGDRPIYSTRDRVEVLTALRDVDHIVVFDDLDCLGSIEAFCPDYFFKSINDQVRPIVQAETKLVNQLGGKAVYLDDCSRSHSSTEIIGFVRQQAEITNACRSALS